MFAKVLDACHSRLELQWRFGLGAAYGMTCRARWVSGIAILKIPHPVG